MINTITRSMPKKMKNDFRQSTKAAIDSWKFNNASSTTNNLSKALQNVQDKWQKVIQISDDCPSDKLDVWVDCKLLLLLLLLLFYYYYLLFIYYNNSLLFLIDHIYYNITIFYF